MFLRTSSSSSRSAVIRSVVTAASTSTTRTISNTASRRLLSSYTTTNVHVIQQRPVLASQSLQSSRWLSSNAKSGEEEATKSDTKEETTATEGTSSEESTTEDAAAADNNKEDELNAQIKDLKDQLLRSYAEQENIRHIAKNDVQAANSFAIKKFAKSLLDVADNLDRALDAVTEEQQSTPEFQSFFQGIEMTKSGLVKALQSNGVTPYCEQPGDVFDPEQHEALMEYPDPTATPGTVGQVIKKGYMLNGRVLRPAEVGVVKK